MRRDLTPRPTRIAPAGGGPGFRIRRFAGLALSAVLAGVFALAAAGARADRPVPLDGWLTRPAGHLSARSAAARPAGAGGREHAPAGAAPVRPAIGQRLPGGVLCKAVLGFRLAVARVRDVRSCGALFTRLGADGEASLAHAVYLAGSGRRDGARCTRDVAAFTWPGDRRTVLCPTFGNLPLDGAAVILIHEALHGAGLGEALHGAGLGEAPSDPLGPRSREINEEVASACGL